jgi:heme/copper-type cytochrome/quinol oxidase subunit 2
MVEVQEENKYEEWVNEQETFASYVAKQKNIELQEKKLAKK